LTGPRLLGGAEEGARTAAAARACSAAGAAACRVGFAAAWTADSLETNKPISFVISREHKLAESEKKNFYNLFQTQHFIPLERYQQEDIAGSGLEWR